MRRSDGVHRDYVIKVTLRIPVVEDEPALSLQLAAAAGGTGYAVDCAADGEQADRLAHSEQYDAVIFDLGLPKIDGLTLLRRWREAGLSLPVPILTARGNWHEKVQGIESRHALQRREVAVQANADLLFR